MEVAFGPLGLSPQVFWSMTMEEFSSACDGRSSGDEEDPLDRSDFERMMEQFPDDPR